MADGDAISLKRGKLHVTAGFELAHDRCGGSHACCHDRLAEPASLALRDQGTRELPPPFGFRNEVRESRVLSAPLENHLVEKISGHEYTRSMKPGSHSVNAMALELRPSRTPPSPVEEAGFRQLELHLSTSGVGACEQINVLPIEGVLRGSPPPRYKRYVAKYSSVEHSESSVSSAVPKVGIEPTHPLRDCGF